MQNNDLISRAALKNELAPQNDWSWGNGAYVRDMIDAMPTVDAEPVRQWISVEDRLPDAAGYECLVCAVNENYNQTHVFTAYTGYGEPGWWTSNVHYMSRAKSPTDTSLHPALKVTHWMPLPEQPTAITEESIAPRVVTLDELINGVGIGCEENWLKGEDGEEDSFVLDECAWCKGGVVVNDSEIVSRAALERLYNRPYGLRVWSREPSAEQREKTPWAG